MSAQNVNFGQVGNDSICDCGRHRGVGDWSAENRAANYARMRENLPSYYEPERRAYLESWEQAHGVVAYRMVPSHQSTAAEQKLFGLTPGTQIMKPVMSDSFQSHQSTPQRRNWHEAA